MNKQIPSGWLNEDECYKQPFFKFVYIRQTLNELSVLTCFSFQLNSSSLLLLLTKEAQRRI